MKLREIIRTDQLDLFQAGNYQPGWSVVEGVIQWEATKIFHYLLPLLNDTMFEVAMNQAVRRGRLPYVQALFSYPDRVKTFIWVPTQAVIERHHLDLLRWLLDQKVTINIWRHVEPTLDMLQLLLGQPGFNPILYLKRGVTSVEMIDVLEQQGIYPGWYVERTFDRACKANNEAVIRRLYCRVHPNVFRFRYLHLHGYHDLIDHYLAIIDRKWPHYRRADLQPVVECSLMCRPEYHDLMVKILARHPPCRCHLARALSARRWKMVDLMVTYLKAEVIDDVLTSQSYVEPLLPRLDLLLLKVCPDLRCIYSDLGQPIVCQMLDTGQDLTRRCLKTILMATI